MRVCVSVEKEILIPVVCVSFRLVQSQFFLSFTFLLILIHLCLRYIRAVLLDLVCVVGGGGKKRRRNLVLFKLIT